MSAKIKLESVAFVRSVLILTAFGIFGINSMKDMCLFVSAVQAGSIF